MPLFRMTKDNGLALNIPADTIRCLEGQTGDDANHPEARSFIRYDLGAGLKVAWLGEDFESLRDRFQRALPRADSWAELTLWRMDREGVPILINPETIVTVEGLDATLPENDGAQSLVHVVGLGPQIDMLPVYECPDVVMGMAEPSPEKAASTTPRKPPPAIRKAGKDSKRRG